MNRKNRFVFFFSGSVASLALVVMTYGCSASSDPATGQGGSSSNGGSSNAQGGSGTGGSGQGGATQGQGGATQGQGGAAQGGAAQGGAAQGGSSSSNGGSTAAGGSSNGGSTAAGGSTSTSGGSTSTSGGATTTSGGSTSTSGGATTTSGGTTSTSSGGATTTSGGSTGTVAACGNTTSGGIAIAKGVACTTADTQVCTKTCGPSNVGVKTETCSATASAAGTYAEGSCTFPADKDYSCYKIPATIDRTACGTATPQHNAACTVAACTVCNDASGNYLDGSSMTKAGYCVCAGTTTMKWSCASSTAWPCPTGMGCQ